MGCYDEVLVHCPKCGQPQYVQSKGGECLLRNYTLENCPDDVFSNINRHAPFTCWEPIYVDGKWERGGPTKGCGTSFCVNEKERKTVECEPGNSQTSVWYLRKDQP